MVLARALGAPWLGHGRMFEFVVGTICALYGLVVLFHPDALWDSQATRDLAWYAYGQLIAAPFLLTATLTGYGLVANICGWPFSRSSRSCGAAAGCFIWGWMETKFVLAGVPFTLGSICAVVFFLGSLRIIGMSSMDLPRPGAPGAR